MQAKRKSIGMLIMKSEKNKLKMNVNTYAPRSGFPPAGD